VYNFLTGLHVVVCIFLMLVVLLQAGRGGGMGIAFGGSGGSQSVFGSSGGANFLTRMTAVCAFIFFANSLTLAYMSSQSDSRRLQKIAEKKATDKKAEDATKAKLASALEKARAEAEKSKSVMPDGAAGGAPTTATETASKTTEEKPAKAAVAKPVAPLKITLGPPPAPVKPTVERAAPEKPAIKLRAPASETATPAEKPAPVKKVRAPKPVVPAEEGAAPAANPAADETAAPAPKPVRAKKAAPADEEAPVAPAPAQP
jgi:preprotein translocase subunit SecG